MSEKIAKSITLETPGKVRMPKRVAAKIDAFYAMQQKRIAYGKKIKEAESVLSSLKEREDVVAKELAKDLRGMGASKMSGEVATFSPGETDVFTIEDWDAFYKFIRENDAFELLERRPGRGALRERLEAGTLPKGVKSDKMFTFSLRKAAKK